MTEEELKELVKEKVFAEINLLNIETTSEGRSHLRFLYDKWYKILRKEHNVG